MRKWSLVIFWAVVLTILPGNAITSAKRDGFWEGNNDFWKRVEGRGSYNNDVLFNYASEETYTLSDFDDHLIFPYMFAMRENSGVLYSIYRLEDGCLCYVIFTETGLNGFTLAIKEVIVYPLLDQESEEKLSFLLEQDRPEKILPTGDVEVSRPET